MRERRHSCFPASVRLLCPDLICEPDTGAPLSVCSVRPIKTLTVCVWARQVPLCLDSLQA